MTSTFPNIFIHLPLRAFNQAEAIQLLDRASPQFTMAEKEKIIYLSAGIPWKLQFIAQRAYDKRETGILNWEEIKQECERQTGYANSQRHNSTQSNKTNALLSSIFIQAPQWIGYAVLGVIKDKDKINGQSALLCGYIVLLILTGVLSYQQIKMALPFLP